MRYTHFVKLKHGEKIKLTKNQYATMVSGMEANKRFVSTGKVKSHVDQISQFGELDRAYEINDGELKYVD